MATTGRTNAEVLEDTRELLVELLRRLRNYVELASEHDAAAVDEGLLLAVKADRVLSDVKTGVFDARMTLERAAING
jgi:hypothetical protein